MHYVCVHRVQRYWVRYMLATALVAYTGSVVYKHSALAGSDDIQRWARKIAKVGA